MIQFILKAIISFFVLISFSLAEEVGQNRVNGSVMNKSEGIPLQGANVQLMGNNDQKYGATTDSEGKFNIYDIEDGRYKISISFIGFEDYKDDVAIESGKTYMVDAVLENAMEVAEEALLQLAKERSEIVA